MLSDDKIRERLEFYRNILGYTRLARHLRHQRSLWPVSNYAERIAGLTERGFEDPEKMISRFPTIIGLTFENIDEKIAGLKERGFKDPMRMIEIAPQILGRTLTSLDTKIAGLRERGFTDPQRMVEGQPQVLNRGFDTIDMMLTGLRERGFTDPQKMITIQPQIVSLTFENIDGKIAVLVHYGLTQPIPLIESTPAILTYSAKSLARRLRKARRLNANVHAFVSYSAVFPGISPKDYVPLVRCCRLNNKEATPRNIAYAYSRKLHRTLK